jgi:RNA polymerase sigma-B factor
MMHVPRRLKELHSQITRATTALAQTLGREPTVSELAETLGADRDEVIGLFVIQSALTSACSAPLCRSERQR